MITQQQLKAMLNYDEKTGVFSWAKPHGKMRQGRQAGYLSWNGYIEIKINKRVYLAHRLAWLFVHGNFPSEHTDHIDGNRANNAISNLREASIAQNLQNQRVAYERNSSGMLGVHKARGKWKAQISVGGKTIYLGMFNTPEEAHSKYVVAKRQHHPFCTI